MIKALERLQYNRLDINTEKDKLNSFKIFWLSKNLFSTHPPIKDRINKLKKL